MGSQLKHPFSGAIGPVETNLTAARQVDPAGELAKTLDEVADPRRLKPEGPELDKLIAELESR